MKFSIVVPTYNRAELVKRCIGFNLENTGVDRREIELVWVDDGSTDNVREVMEEFEPDISILKKENEGVFKAYNAGYVATTGDWIVKMGSDMIFPDNWLAVIKEYIKKIPESAGIGFIIDGFFDCPFSGWAGKEKIINGMPTREARNIMGVHAFSRKLFKEVGYFDEVFGWYGPGDWDWSDRAIRTKKLIYYIPKLRANHLGVGKWNHNNAKKLELTVQGDKILKNHRENSCEIYYSPFV